MITETRILNKKFFENTAYNEVLFESDNFVVLPSLGALVEGWLLVVPKKYALCFGELEFELFAELDNLIFTVRNNLQDKYGEFVVFEHGASIQNTLAGCGVDYAHLHMVPIQIDLIKGLNLLPANPSYVWHTAPSLSETRKYFKEGRQYLLVQNPSQKLQITHSKEIPSQLFRKVIAAFLNVPDKFDWKVHSENINIEKTIRNVRIANRKKEVLHLME